MALASKNSMSSSDYSITASTPSPAEYALLRNRSGLSAPPGTPEAHAAGLARSLHTIVARIAGTGEAVGMGRAVGDGSIFILVVDMCVLPEHQSRGLGRKILNAILEWIDQHAPNAYVTLGADPPGVKLYESCGFEVSVAKAMKRSKWGT